MRESNLIIRQATPGLAPAATIRMTTAITVAARTALLLVGEDARLHT